MKTSTRYRHGFRLASALIATIIAPICLFSQEESVVIAPQQQRITGTAFLSTDYRSTTRSFGEETGGATDGTIMLQAEFPWGRIPVDFSISTRKDVYNRNYLRYGIHPELFNGNIRLHAGDFYTSSPELTFGRTSLFGVGTELQLGKFRAAANYGELETPFSSYLTEHEPLDIHRNALELGLGFGNDTAGFLDLRFSKIVDNVISAEPNDIAAQENSAIATRLFLPLFNNKFQIEGEGSISAWSSDRSADLIENGTPILSAIFTPRLSSQFDGAARLAVRYAPSYAFSVTLNGSWIGPGYVVLSQPWMQNDLAQASINPTISLFDGKLYANGSVGIQQDNLRGTKEGRTTTLIGSLYATTYAANWLTFNLSWNDYGSSSNHSNDTARYGYVSRSLAFSPTAYWQGFGGTNSGTLNLAMQDGKTRNLGGIFSQTNIQSVDGTWALALPSSLSLTTRVGYSITESEGFNSSSISIDETVSHTILKGNLTGSITGGVSHYLKDNAGTSLNFGATVMYSLKGFGRISLLLSNSFDRGFGSNATPGRELYGALRYGMNF